jgi:hypothetical protein
MSWTSPDRNAGLTLRQAALVAGLAYIMPVSYVEFSIWPKLVVPGNIEQTVLNISSHPRLFAIAILLYLITFIEDIVIAWALYVLLVPVNRSLSLLTAWFRLVYAVMALFALLNLVAVHRLLTTSDYLTLFGPGPLHAQVQFLLRSFRYDSSMALVIFGIHLVLLGYMIYRSQYIPRVIGVLLVYDGLGWVIVSFQPYFYPSAPLRFFFITSFVELVLPLWLLIRGSKIEEPAVVPG